MKHPQYKTKAEKVLLFLSSGGIDETHEMWEFCGQLTITAAIEVIEVKNINEAYGRIAIWLCSNPETYAKAHP